MNGFLCLYCLCPMTATHAHKPVSDELYGLCPTWKPIYCRLLKQNTPLLRREIRQEVENYFLIGEKLDSETFQSYKPYPNEI